MAEETVVKDVLTDNMIEAGQALTNALERRRWPFVAAFWLYDWETNRWKLVFASPVVEKGPTAAYGEVLAVRKGTSPTVDFDAVLLVSPRDRYVRELLELVDRGLHIDGRRIRSGAVEDSYVYRVRPTASAA